MNKNKKIFSFSILALSVLTTLGVISTLNTNGFVAAKAECDHHQVNHYVGNSNRTYAGSEGEYVDHWICCGCHTVWADEARTIVLGNSQTDRTKIDLRNITSYKFEWDWNGTPYYSEELGVYYKNTLLGSGGFDGVNYNYYVETSNAQEVNPELITSISFTLFNDTKFDLNVRLEDFDNTETFAQQIVASNTNYTFELTPEQYNKGSRGFEFWFTGTDSTITSEDTIRVTTPKFIKKTDPHTFTNQITGQNYPTNGQWGPIPHDEDGTYHLSENYGYHYFDPRTLIPDWATLYLNFTNPTDTDATINFGHVVTDTIIVSARSSKTFTITSDIWNAPVNSEITKIRFLISNASELNLNMHYAYDNTIDTFIEKLDAVKLNDITFNNLYVTDVYTNLIPVIESIKAYYGANIPAEITSHEYWIDYTDASTFVGWENAYGIPSVGTKMINGVAYAEVTATDAGEQSIITRSFVNTTNKQKLMFSIYNDSDSQKAVNVFNGYGEPWNVGGQVQLPAKQWTVISYDKTLFDEPNQGFSFIFQGCEVGQKFYVSPIVDYAYETNIEGEVVYNGNITLRGKGWASANLIATKYGATYLHDAVNSSTEDPEWKCTMFYLNAPTKVDASKHSYVKFYVYNNTNQSLFIALKGAGSQYNFDGNGNVVPMNEWKEFTIPAEKWNEQGDHLELIFSSNTHHSGSILVTTFVGA